MRDLDFPDAPLVAEHALTASRSAAHGLELSVAELVEHTLAARGVETNSNPRYAAKYLVSAAETVDFTGIRPDMASVAAKVAVSTVAHLLALPESEARMLAYLAFSRVGTMRTATDAKPWRHADEVEFGFIGDTDDLAAVFEETVYEPVVGFLARHFGVDAKVAACVAPILLDRDSGYLSDKMGPRALSALAAAHGSAARPEDGVHEVLALLAAQDGTGKYPRLFDMRGMRKFLIDQYGLETEQGELFLRLVRPLLDRAFARCFARFLADRRQSLERA